MHDVEGKKHKTHIKKEDGEERLVKNEFSGNGKIASIFMEETKDKKYSRGVTISLGSYEFGRATLGVKIGFPLSTPKSEKEEICEKAKSFVDELIGREEAAIRKEEYREADIEFKGGIKRFIWVEYGLTLKGRKPYESDKIDIGESEYVSEGESILEVMSGLQSDVSEELAKYREEIQSTKKSV